MILMVPIKLIGFCKWFGCVFFFIYVFFFFFFFFFGMLWVLPIFVNNKNKKNNKKLFNIINWIKKKKAFYWWIIPYERKSTLCFSPFFFYFSFSFSFSFSSSYSFSSSFFFFLFFNNNFYLYKLLTSLLKPKTIRRTRGRNRRKAFWYKHPHLHPNIHKYKIICFNYIPSSSRCISKSQILVLKKIYTNILLHLYNY
jgi:hypothetical protein